MIYTVIRLDYLKSCKKYHTIHLAITLQNLPKRNLERSFFREKGQ